MGEFYLGQIILFAGTFAPVGWKLCDGTLISVSENEALFTILGTTYGGDGQSTFGLPDLRGAIPVGMGQAPGRSNYVLGMQGGSENITLISSQMPGHTHPVVVKAQVNVTDKAADQASPGGGVFAQSDTSMFLAAPDASSALNERAVTTNVTLGLAGGSQPISIQMPYLAMSYCICTEGIFPSE